MLTSLFLLPLMVFCRYLVGLFPELSNNLDFNTDVLQFLVNIAGFLGAILPIRLIVDCLMLQLTWIGLTFGYSLIEWVIKKIPGIN